jgi:hypothetical protein
MNDTIGLAPSPWKGRYKSCSHSGYKNALPVPHSCYKYESNLVGGVSVRRFTYKKQDFQPQIPGMSNSGIHKNYRNFDMQINLLA